MQYTIYTSTKCDLEETGVLISKGNSNKNNFQKAILRLLSRYNFWEPQFGKDVYHRIIIPLKSAVRRYCNEGHDILSAADMHGALKARPVKGCTAAVCEVDRNDQEIKVNHISNFSTFHKFL